MKDREPRRNHALRRLWTFLPLVVVCSLGFAWPEPASASFPPPIYGPAGYWMVASDGGIFSFGPGAAFYGSDVGQHVGDPSVGMTVSGSGAGYFEVSAGGIVTPHGDAAVSATTGSATAMADYGNDFVLVTNAAGKVWAIPGPTSPLAAATYNCLPGLPNEPIVGIANAGLSPTPGTDELNIPAYWLVASDGGVFACNGAPYFGSMGGQKLNAPIVGMATDGTFGYWLVASDGGIFAFGDVPFLGSMGGHNLNSPIVGITPYEVEGPGGMQGYWEVASDGGIFSFGAAPFLGSMGGRKLNAPIVGMSAVPISYCCLTG